MPKNSKTDSPFFEQNKKLYSRFKVFIEQQEGQFKGEYNAWSYAMLGKINATKPWVFKYKKATFTSGHLLLSSKAQTLLTTAEWTTKCDIEKDIFIKQRTFLDHILQVINPKLFILHHHKNYITNAEEDSLKKLQTYIKVLEPCFKTAELEKLTTRGGILKIKLKTEKLHLKIIERFIDFQV